MLKRLFAAGAAFGAIAFAAASVSAQTPSTLETVKKRDQVICGVNVGLAGFSLPNSQGKWTGLDIDMCNAVAAAVLGDATKAKYVPLSAQQRFLALQSGEIDVLVRNSTITLERDAGLGIQYAGINFYDGQGFMVPKKLNVKGLAELAGATICVAQGTTHEFNMASWFRGRNLQIKAVVFESQDVMYEAFFAGRCDAMTQDSSALASALATRGKQADYMVLPELISKEPLGPFVRRGDDVWLTVVRWSFMAMLEAEERGITKANVDEELKSDRCAGEALPRCHAGQRQGAADRREVGLQHRQAGRQLRRELRAQRRHGQPAQAAARAQRPVDQERPDVPGPAALRHAAETER